MQAGAGWTASGVEYARHIAAASSSLDPLPCTLVETTPLWQVHLGQFKQAAEPLANSLASATENPSTAELEAVNQVSFVIGAAVSSVERVKKASADKQPGRLQYSLSALQSSCEMGSAAMLAG